jgi:hypothetical protein
LHRVDSPWLRVYVGLGAQGLGRVLGLCGFRGLGFRLRVMFRV